jgi:hypothetical protein
VRGYDPALDAPPKPAEIVVCTDMLEDSEPEFLDNALADIARCATRAVFLVVHTQAALKILPDGRNAHLIQQPYEWWPPKFTLHWDRVSEAVGTNGFRYTGLARSGPHATAAMLQGPGANQGHALAIRESWRHRMAESRIDASAGPELMMGPVLAHGLIARIVKFPDGGGAVETWDPSERRWLSAKVARADAGDVFSSPVATIFDLSDAGVPKADWGDAVA